MLRHRYVSGTRAEDLRTECDGTTTVLNGIDIQEEYFVAKLCELHRGLRAQNQQISFAGRNLRANRSEHAKKLLHMISHPYWEASRKRAERSFRFCIRE